MHEHEDNSTNKSATGRLPRWVYALLVGLAGWFALASWIFAAPGPTDYLLVVVSGFIFVAVGLLFILGCVKRNEEPGPDDQSVEPPSFRDRSKWDLEVFQSRLSVSQAAMQILLPLATAALGMTAIGIAMRIAEHIGS